MLEARGVTRRFADRNVVEAVDLSVSAGEIVGFVGANGAGKTTTMRMIMGVLQPTAGQILWAGRPATTDDRRHFGYMPEERGLYPKQPIGAQLVYLGQLYGLSQARAQRAAADLLERFDLHDRAKDKLESLSLGNQQRVQIAAAVLADPVLLVLDEPFSGLDPVAVDSMCRLLRELVADGAGVLFSSHQLDLVEQLSDRVVALSNGRVVAEGTSMQLRRSGTVLHRLSTSGVPQWLHEVPDIRVVELGEGHATIELRSRSDNDRLLREALNHGPVYEFAEVLPPLATILQEAAA